MGQPSSSANRPATGPVPGRELGNQMLAAGATTCSAAIAGGLFSGLFASLESFVLPAERHDAPWSTPHAWILPATIEHEPRHRGWRDAPIGDTAGRRQRRRTVQHPAGAQSSPLEPSKGRAVGTDGGEHCRALARQGSKPKRRRPAAPRLRSSWSVRSITIISNGGRGVEGPADAATTSCRRNQLTSFVKIREPICQVLSCARWAGGGRNR